MNFFRTTDDRRRAREIFLQQIGAHTGSTDDPQFVEAAERFEDTEETLSAVRDALIEYRRAIMMLGKASVLRVRARRRAGNACLARARARGTHFRRGVARARAAHSPCRAS